MTKKYKLINVVSFAEDHLASFRLRQKVISEWVNSNSDEWRMVISNIPDVDADVNVFFKHINPDTMLNWAKILRQQSKTKIVFDITDNWFNDALAGPFYMQMCQLAHVVTVSSDNLQKIVLKLKVASLENCFVVNEPTQLEWVTDEQRNNKERKGKYVWMGHKSNLKTLNTIPEQCLEDLTVICDKDPKIKTGNVKFIKWYEGAEELLLDYETVLLPQTDPYKSPNRLIDAVFAGCRVETFDSPAYKGYRQSVDAYKDTHTLDAITNRWLLIFQHALQIEKVGDEFKPHPALEGKKYVRLNIGCGNKIYPKKEGWINIDLINHPDIDIQHDVRRIHEVLGPETADEIHAYHVCEHIYPNELQTVLTNWYSVLKPGGKIVIEMPDFLKAAKNILQFETTQEPAIWMDLGLKAFYGDYDPRNPNVVLDLHKWLWTYKTFMPEMERVGFTDLHEQTPNTHRAERDFRIVGYK